MSEPLPPLDDELELMLAPGRIPPELPAARYDKVLAGVHASLAAAPSSSAAPQSGTAPSTTSGSWPRGLEFLLGLLVGAAGMWALLPSTDTTEPVVDAAVAEERGATDLLPALAVEPVATDPVVDVPANERSGRTVETSEQTRRPTRPQPSAGTPSETPELTEPSALPEPAASLGASDALLVERRIIDAALAQVSRGHAADALHTVERHETAFPQGQLSEAREVVRIRAFILLRRRQDAERALASFSLRFPGSRAATSLAERISELD